MGAALSNIILEAERVAGLQGKLILSGITRMTTGQAASALDTPQLISQFKAALAEVKASVRSSGTELPAGNSSPETLRRHMDVYLDLMTQRSLVLGDPLETARRVDELAAETLNIARVSVWMLDAESTKITCTDLFERAGGKHSSGTVLFAKDFKPYFVALATQRTIAAHDAQTDPRTACFTTVYLKPLGITSMLDVPVWVNAKMVGVVCHEHLGPARQWNTDEERFAYLMAAFVSLSMERHTGSARL
ncbi:MAG: GAF domain-containing protein [Archangium sp.]|nr:GAF domain-containing protein [Archangium sp.]